MIVVGSVWFAFLLTVFAGLSTGIGSLIALFTKKVSNHILAISLGFSAGVMIYVSMVEIFVKALDSLTLAYGGQGGFLATNLAFFAGMLIIGLIDKILPSEQNPHDFNQASHMHDEEGKQILIDGVKEREDRSKLMRTGVFTALAIAIHNFPEGLATFISALQDPTIAIPIVVAIAIHNIPEGMAVSYPIYYATGSKKKAFLYSFASGLSEPIGAIIGYLILMPFMNDVVYGILFGVVAGIMVYISIDELLPSAQEYGEHHLSIYGMIAGMIVMSVSLWLFK
jgi:ZIP family zinc transporter